jgi:Fur family zinc uptake transcriptional regulator
MVNRSTTLPGNAVHNHADHGVGLTETRRKVFELVIKAGQPVGAYRLLEAMQDKGTRVMPPTVYRALNFLQGKGLVHRIESLNAFVACTQHEHEHEGQFLICSDCGKTEELADESVSEMLREKATAHGFTLMQQTIELRGLCKDCASD